MTDQGSRWSSHTGVQRGQDYDRTWAEMAAVGESIHGEADFLCGFEPSSVLDAGCGTGRVAIELANRGIDVVGVDLDPAMLAAARTKAPHLDWIEGDLTAVEFQRDFEVIAMPGNVMIFVQPGSEARVIANLARHLCCDGVLVAGFQLGRGYAVDQYDADCVEAGLTHIARYSTWAADQWRPDDDYALSVHRA